MIRRVGAIAVVAAAGLWMGACGSCGTPSASSSSSQSHSPSPSAQSKLISSVDACTLVMATDASTAAGTTVASLSNGAQIPGACFYATPDGTTTVIVFAQAYPDSVSAGAVNPEQIAAAINRGVGVSNAKPVSGIGDRAVEYSTTGSANGTVIFAFKSNVVVMIAITPAPASSSAIEQLARTAVGRL